MNINKNHNQFTEIAQFAKPDQTETKNNVKAIREILKSPISKTFHFLGLKPNHNFLFFSIIPNIV